MTVTPIRTASSPPYHPRSIPRPTISITRRAIHIALMTTNARNAIIFTRLLIPADANRLAGTSRNGKSRTDSEETRRSADPLFSPET